MVDLLGLSNSMTPTPMPTCDVLVIADSNGQNLLLAEHFAAAAREQDQSAEVLDLNAIDLPLFTARAQAGGTPSSPTKPAMTHHCDPSKTPGLA